MFEKSTLSGATGVSKNWSPCLHGGTLMMLCSCGWTDAASGAISEWVLNEYSLGRGQMAWEMLGAFSKPCQSEAVQFLCRCSSAYGFLAINLLIKNCWWEGKRNFEEGKSATPDWLNVNGKRWWTAPKRSRQTDRQLRWNLFIKWLTIT